MSRLLLACPSNGHNYVHKKMFNYIKRERSKQNKRKTQQFLQQASNDKFEMILVEQQKQATACTKPSHDRNSMPENQVTAPPVEFKPMATSTPKRKTTSTVADVNLNTKLGPRLTMSQFLGELPANTHKKCANVIIKSSEEGAKPPKQVTVKLQNFINKPQNAFETIVIDTFTDNDSFQMNTKPQTSSHQQKKPVEAPTPNLDSTRGVLRAIFNEDFCPNTGLTAAFKNTIESILNATGAVEPSSVGLQNQLLKRPKPLQQTLIAANDSTFKDIFENPFDRELLEMSSRYFPKFKVPNIPNSRPRKTHHQQASNIQKPIFKPTVNDCTFLDSFLNAPEQAQRAEKPVLRSHEFENDLQMLLQICQQRTKGYDDPSNGFAQGNSITLDGNNALDSTDHLEFWKKDEDLSFLNNLLGAMESPYMSAFLDK